MREIDSQALHLLSKVLRLSGGQAPGLLTRETNLDEQTLQLVLDAVPVIRRSYALAGTSGLFTGLWTITALGAGIETVDIDPYQPPSVVGPYPAVVDPSLFEIWLLEATLTSSAAGIVSGAQIRIAYPATMRAFPTAAGSAPTWVAWDGDVTIAGSVLMTANSDVSKINQGHPVRLPPGVTVSLRTDFTGAGDCSAHVTLALVPVSLGQDAR